MRHKSVALQGPGGFNKLPLSAAYPQLSNHEQDGDRFWAFAVHSTETTQHCRNGPLAVGLPPAAMLPARDKASISCRSYQSQYSGRIPTLDRDRRRGADATTMALRTFRMLE